MVKKDQLHFYKFLTLKLINDDLYPHYSYGEQFNIEEIKDFWHKTVNAMLKGTAPQKLGLYIHIPFCRYKCAYCMCDSYAPESCQEVKSYLNILNKEISMFSPLFRKVKFTSIYFGGGSPSLLSGYELEVLFRHIYKNFFISDSCQVIFEASPTDLNKEKLSILARYGVNRLTIGLQSLDPKVIKLINRPQTKEKFIRVFKDARKLGIPYINVDLMAGLEGQSIRSFLSDLKLVINIGADIIHVNGFMPLPHTPFSMQGKYMSSLQMQRRERMIIESERILGKLFIRRIGVEDGAGSLDDAANIQETDLRKENSSLLGLGYNAHSHAFGQVWYQHPHLVFFRHKPIFKKIPDFWGVRSSLDEEMRKFVVTNLRSGFYLSFFEKLFQRDARSIFMREFLELSNINKIRIIGTRFDSYFKNRQEVSVFSKLFYSKDRIAAIMKVHKSEYDPSYDYGLELNNIISNKE